MRHIIVIADLLNTPITWKQTPGKTEWSALVDGDICGLRLNDFPDEQMWTVNWRGQELDFDDRPAQWSLELAPRKRPSPHRPR